MLSRFTSISTNVLSIILYVPSPAMTYFLQTVLKERFEMHKDFVVSVDTAKALQNAKLDSYVAPLMCEKWLIHVNADKLQKKELFAALANNTAHGITVYWTTKYMVYMQMTDSEIVKKLGVHCPNYSFSRLGYNDIKYLHTKMVGEKRALTPELLDYVCKSYNFDVESVCELFSFVKSGNPVETKRDIIEAVGVGGNSVSSLTIKILSVGSSTYKHPMAGKAKPKPPKKNADGSERKKRPKMTPREREIKFRTNALAATLKLLDDLSITYNYASIRRFMLSTVEAFIDMKQLQIMGLYGRVNREIPDTFDSKRMSMNKRFEQAVLTEISLPKLLNLKLCLLNYNSFNAEIALIQAISEFFTSVRLPKEVKS
jgi:hypothetical protein